MAQPIASIRLHTAGAVALVAVLLCACTATDPSGTEPNFSHGAPQSDGPDEVPGPVSFPLEATIPEIQDAMEAGQLTSVELVEFYLARIAAYDRAGPELNAFIVVNPAAIEEAAALDAERAESGARGSLHGIPVVVKDNINTADMPTTAGSLALEGFEPIDDAFQVRKLREAGAIILGKSNLPDFAYSWSTVSSLGGATLNPYGLHQSPGGSSGGSAVAVAANLAAVGLGTDTCGSVRLPAARNNLYALRPTSGLSSRTGVIPLSPTLDAVGPITRNVIDLAILLDATAGEDPDDPTTVAVDAAYAEAVDSEGLTGRRIGLVSFPAGSEAADPLERALEEVAANGAEVIAVTVPDEPDRDPYAFMNEFGSAMDDYLAARPEGMFRSVKDIAAFYLDHPDVSQDLPPLVATLETDTYREAVERRPLFREGIIAFMDEHDLDAIAYPAAAIGGASEPFDCESAAMGGLPAIVIPAGFTALGLPIGLELMGRPFDEATLIAIAAGYEAHTDHRMLPPTTPPLASVS